MARKRPETVADTRTTARSIGLPQNAAAAFVTATARDRHLDRVNAFMRAARDEYRRAHATMPQSHAAEIQYAIAVLVLDAFGLVSDTGPTHETTKVHHRAFRTGCGPRTGPIATVTHAAAREAVDNLYAALFALEHPALPQPQRGCPFIRIMPSVAPVGITFKVSACSPITLCIEPTETENSQAPGWTRTLAVEGLRRAMGRTPWFALRGERVPGPNESRPSASIFDLIIFDGTAADWGVVLSAAIERRRVDTIATHIASFISAAAKLEPLFWLPPWAPPSKKRVSLDYIERWLSMALGDETAKPVIAAVMNGTAVDVAMAWDKATRAEFEWMTRIECMVAPMAPMLPTVGSADWSRDWLSLATLFMVASAVGSGSDAQLGYAERAVNALRRFGTPVLSPEPSLGLQFDECDGVVLIDSVLPTNKFAAERYGETLVMRIVEMLERRPASAAAVEHLCGARIIGTAAEWRAVAAALALRPASNT